VTVLFFTIISACILLLLQIIAGNSQEDDGHSLEIIKQNQAIYELDIEQNATDPRGDIDHAKLDLKDLLVRIDDLKRIKQSVRNELRLLQQEKTKILREKANLASKNERILSQINKNKSLLKQLELDLSANKKQKAQQSCSSDAVIPIMFNPLRALDISSYSYTGRRLKTKDSLTVEKGFSDYYQFDLRLCPLAKGFTFNLANNREQILSKLEGNIDLATLLLLTLESHHFLDQHNQQTCMTVIFLYDTKFSGQIKTRNNLVINLSGRPIDRNEHRDVIENALVASSSFTKGSFRHNTDIVIPRIVRQPEILDTILDSIPLQSPLKRKYFASYFGNDELPGNRSDYSSATDEILQTIHRSSVDDMFLFIYNCGRHKNRECYDERERMLGLSTFLIIIPDENYDIDYETNDLIYLALSRGTIPVILGGEQIRLPLAEAIDWRLGSILLPIGRLPELHFILRTLSPADLYSLKYHGRRIFEQYLATSKQIIDSTISLISLNRLNYPPAPIQSAITKTHYPSQSLKLDTNCESPVCLNANAELMNNLLTSEILGPREKPFKSAAFGRNYSLTLTRTYDLWNHPLFSPNYLFPSHPSDPICPSEYKFISADLSYHPINDGIGGSGLEFSKSLGGDFPNEQFTIVLLTYERVPILMRTLERLKGLAYLNKVLIVWNGINQAPREDFVWPDIGVPIVLVKVDRNSLNNRFLPYDAIETDAIFSMDDDSPLRPDEIVFAFRVWRESRDRIVGFPGRYHAWDNYQNSWLYNSNHSCELSMVLTGGAFFHKYYSFIYSQIMPDSIRSIVDKFMNCEDIAMNFLVAHLTRKPPIKVTSRWTFHCASCTTSLSEDQSHFMERHECLNIFTSIYGYMPLLNTQHRSDSILFKTRLPRDKQKCFKFV
jgi:alpha-1,4-N-acetylglucosaminyltransferase EXTL3